MAYQLTLVLPNFVKRDLSDGVFVRRFFLSFDLVHRRHIQCILIFEIYRGRFVVRCMLCVRVYLRFAKLTLCAAHFMHVNRMDFRPYCYCLIHTIIRT